LDSVSPTSSGSLRILVLGDYILSKTQQQMRLLEKAGQRLPEDAIITVKPHPACPIQPADYPGLRLEVTMKPVSNLLGACDVAYTSSGTSAAVDAYCAGTPVVSVLDPNALNLSPLRGREGVIFASTPEELAHALISAASAPRSAAGQQDFFTLDSKLPRWRKLLLESIG
jgi:surface carbohydrate biosynthesis protein (TIGR04326 family)